MPLTTIGETILKNAIAKGFADTQLATVYLGMGDGDAPFNPDQTDLQGTNKARSAMLEGFPQAVGHEVRFVAEFDLSSSPLDIAQIAELGLFDSPSGGNMIYRGLTNWEFEIYPDKTYHSSIIFIIGLPA
jgi:hypothetical protein